MTSEDPASNPRVGVGAVIRHPTTGKLLVGQRLSSHGHGTWQFPGGHLEYAESIFTCAERETLEETGLVVRATRLAAVTNSVFSDAGKHYITLFVLCEPVDPSAEPQALEPDKAGDWQWMEWSTIRDWVRHHDNDGDDWPAKRLFLPIRELVNGKENETAFTGF
ncbi:Putative NUDIX hydrolase domain-containing protein [Colletotrichum destructivum]|uniref:NUDIX hydrolase domain-containing protein n=1 Tax=Colletotrichum destructivum TaxID=34406 RepID=A0AAX4IY15_9PEZI|nr:Putative NUDIX hydrolase domain-containing protein [Colletotrichum destructivum]